MKAIVRPALTMPLSDASQYNKDDCDLNIMHTWFGTNKTGSSQTVHSHGGGGSVSVGVKRATLHKLPNHGIIAALSRQPSQSDWTRESAVTECGS